MANNFNYIAYLGESHAPVQANLCHPGPNVSSAQQTTKTSRDLYLKVLSPKNKKEFKAINLRGLSKENIDDPSSLRKAIADQCDDLNPDSMEVGYFAHSKKLWINNRLDINDVWAIIERGDKITLWCLDTSRETQKRKHNDQGCEDFPPSSKKSCPGQSSVEERRATTSENKQKLEEQHKDKYTPFQLNLWAEMLTYGTHNSLEEPPSAVMFNRDKKGASCSSVQDSAVVSGMMTAVSSICQALRPKDVQETLSSPMKKAQLRGMYMKQLNELRQLYDSEILSKEEYEEQRSDLVKLLRKLSDN